MMEYVIDPEGDLLLVLVESSEKIHLDLVRAESETSRPLPFALITIGETAETDASQPSSATQSPCLFALGNTALVDVVHNRDRPVSIGQNEIFKIRVSSKHLILASPYFRRRLFMETIDLESVGQDIVPACVEDLDALFILLDIIHCQTRKVPRFITFKKLYMIAVLAHRYECVEAVEAFAEVWAENLKGDVPSVYSDDLAKWICVAWVFQQDGLFKKTTRVAVRQSTGPVSAMDVPLPRFVVDEIECTRQGAIHEIVDCLCSRIDWELMPDGGVYCCDDCDAMILGAVLRHLKTRQLYPLPLPPFQGISFEFMLRTLDTFPEPRCNELIHGSCGSLSKCLTMPKARDLLENLDIGVVGLELGDILF
ncbi:hypothetical protein BBP40_010872 [Aspergillus hancockii]|nr:hypothetical protein BBP40_010872 [Aspergillus hancockii]